MKLATYFQQFFILLLVACLTRAQEVDNESEFSYDENSEFGPAHWGEIRPEWEKCSSGTMQSPIDLQNQRVETATKYLGPIITKYMPSSATLINRGHDIMLRWSSGAGYVQINGTRYQLKQSHWHSPSEHLINGKSSEMELHLVHQTSDNRTAVIAIMYKIGRPDSFLSMIKQDLEAVQDTQDVETSMGIINPTSIKFDTKSYYRYMGSLTTPPCTENVVWTIVKQVRTVSREQLKLIRDCVHDNSEANARPIQPINGRTVKLYKPQKYAAIVDYLETIGRRWIEYTSL